MNSIDLNNNWLFGLALDPASLPAIDTALSHTYAAPGNYRAFTDSCCRISAVAGVNEHINNPDGGYRVETIINVGTSNNSPVSALPPIIQCPINGVCSFLVPAADPDGDALRFRLSTSPEASSFGGFVQPGPPNAPNAASIDPATGLYTWNTAGATLASNPANNTLYSTQVTIEDGLSKVALDFLIQLVPADPEPPVIGPPPGSPPICQTTQVFTVGQTKTFGVMASDPDASETVTLNAVALPAGATLTPPLPIAGNPVSSTFSWTPTAAQVGVHVITFIASSSGGGFVLCSVTIEVILKITVSIDIKPGSFPNSINPWNRGVIPVAILSTTSFNATLEVDKTSLTFGRTGNEASLAFCANGGEDVNGDGRLDVVCHFYTQRTGFQTGDTEGILKGRTVGGVPIEGRDSVRILK